MKNVSVSQRHENQRAPYETPAVIYEGLISTRAGSSIMGGAGNDASNAAVDTSDLFDQ